MYSSGITAIGTSGASNVTLIALPTGSFYNRLVIYNEGTTAGFFSIDNGGTWGRIPAATTAAPGYVEVFGRSSSSVLIKRDTTDMTKVYGFVDTI